MYQAHLSVVSVRNHITRFSPFARTLTCHSRIFKFRTNTKSYSVILAVAIKGLLKRSVLQRGIIYCRLCLLVLVRYGWLTYSVILVSTSLKHMARKLDFAILGLLLAALC